MKNIFKNNKGQMFGNLSSLATGAVSLGILLAIVFVVLGQVRTNSTISADGNATATINTVVDAVNDIPSWMPLLILVAIGALVLAYVRFFK